MANALDQNNIPPPAENQQPQASPTSNGLSSQGAGPPATPPAPTHQQAVAALRHFDAIEKELSGLLADPDLGKSDLKSKIIDGATKLVAKGIVQPTAAVGQLSQVPERPFDQKQWIQQQYIQTIMSADAVMTNYRHANAGKVEIGAAPSQDDHAQHISALADAYKRGK